MSDSLSSLVDNLSETKKKEPENEFIDCMRSMLASLSSIINDLSENNKKISLAVLIEKFPKKRKGIYPYEYMDRWERFNEE